MSEKISVVINTYNAGGQLADALRSVRDFDEIVVCDMESTDDTVAIARAAGARVVTFPRGEHRICEPARQTAIDAATNPWVLVVDADERVTPALRDWLYRHVESANPAQALSVPFVSMFMGRPVHGRRERHVRFFRREGAVWPPVIHSHVRVPGRTEEIPMASGAVIEHFDNPTVSARLAKIDRYSTAEVPKRRSRRYGATAMLLRPGWFMFKTLVLGGGWRDGRRGIIRAWLEGFYQVALLGKWLEDREK